MPRRSKDRRTTALDALTARLEKVTRPCVATTVESGTPGVIGMIFMACPLSAACARCDDARARLRPWPKPPTPAPFTDDDAPEL